MTGYDRDALLAATDLTALADELLGPHHGSETSPTWPCPNPTHTQTGRTPPVTVFRGRRGEQRWHCHGCSTGGTAVDLIMATHGCRVREAFDTLANRSGIPDTRPLPPPWRPRLPPPPRIPRDRVALDAYVTDCAQRLHTRHGKAVHAYLTGARRIPDAVLATNRIGADPGRHRQPRPDGVPNISGRAAVFPLFDTDDQLAYAQLRLLHPGPRTARYLNLKASFAPNPKVGLYQPVERVSDCVVVTEGPTDALSAAAAGYRAAPVLGTGTAQGTDEHVARTLARIDGPLVVAFDPHSSDAAATALIEQLRTRGRHPTRLHVPATRSDLNDWMHHSHEWPKTLQAAIHTAIRTRPSRQLSRSLAP